MLTALAVLAAGAANAGVITFFDDRTSWENAVIAAGLTLTTEDFAAMPATYPNLDVGGVRFTVPDGLAVYDAANQRVGHTSGGGRTLGLDYTGGLPPLFGFGLDLGPTTGNLRATDVEGVGLADHGLGTAGHFVGLLGTRPLDPANPFPTNPALAGWFEFGTSGLAGDVYLDNLSVATGALPVAEPPAMALAALGLVAAGLGRRRARQVAGRPEPRTRPGPGPRLRDRGLPPA